MTALRTRWMEYLWEHPRSRTIDIAQALDVSEGELLSSRVGEDAVSLRPDWQRLLEGLGDLGQVMALTRNAHVVHESTGRYERVQYSPHMVGVFGSEIEQRLMVGQWAVAIAAPVETRHGPLQSIQIFDRAGTAVLKIYERQQTDTEAWAALISDLSTSTPPPQSWEPAAEPAPRTPVDAEDLRRSWAAMTDTHQTYPLLRRLGAAREQALELVGLRWAVPVEPSMVQSLLQDCAADQEPIMLFVGNTGAIQIHSGLIGLVVPTDEWINVLDPTFNLHARRDGIARVWVVRKPTDRGLVLSVEVFSDDGTLVLQLFGKRTEDQSQAPSWHERLEAFAQHFPCSNPLTPEAT